ncbi:MAG: flagellar hook-length control protein FliK [bacterium]
MNITPLPPIDQKLIDFKVTPEVKIGNILEGVVEEVLGNKTYLFKLKGFTFKARSPLTFKKYDRVQIEIKSLEPKIVFKLLPSTVKSTQSTSKQIGKTKQLDTNYLYFSTSNLSYLGMNNLAVKRFETKEEISPKGAKSEYEAFDILLEMSELGKVLVKITRQGNSSYYQIAVEDKKIKEFVEENIQRLLTDLKSAGYAVSNISCTINPCLKSKDSYFKSTLIKTEKGYSRFDEFA